MKTWSQIALGILIGLVLAGAVAVVAIPSRGEPFVLEPLPTANPFQVYVTGEVLHPGVYAVPAGSRVGQALEAAGGALATAKLDSVNLAAPLKDGQKIAIPALSADAPAVRSATLSATGLININTATLQELDSLPGIGEVKAQQIIAYRDENGAFKSIDEIQDVPGIGPELFEKIKDSITVD